MENLHYGLENCFEVKDIIDGVGFDIVKNGIIARPVYDDNEMESDDCIEPIGYELEEV